jgi:hypothetical protein
MKSKSFEITDCLQSSDSKTKTWQLVSLIEYELHILNSLETAY